MQLHGRHAEGHRLPSEDRQVHARIPWQVWEDPRPLDHDVGLLGPAVAAVVDKVEAGGGLEGLHPQRGVRDVCVEGEASAGHLTKQRTLSGDTAICFICAN